MSDPKYAYPYPAPGNTQVHPQGNTQQAPPIQGPFELQAQHQPQRLGFCEGCCIILKCCFFIEGCMEMCGCDLSDWC